MSQSKYSLARGAKKSLLPPSAAEYYFETDVFSMISRSEIMENTSVSNDNLWRSAKLKFVVVSKVFFCRCRRQKNIDSTLKTKQEL